MAEQSADGKIIHFTCDHCKIALTVDDALVGVSGPCPSCGESITAPSSRVPKALVGTRHDHLAGEGSGKGSHPEVRDRGRVEKAHETPAESGISEVNRERAEVTTVAKMLVAGVVVLIIVGGAIYLLKQ